MSRQDRAAGAVVGSAVGDALGAPFEFGPEGGVYTTRFPDGVGTMCGGGGWGPDHATEFNGAVWPCLGTALWALRTTRSYEDALASAIDVGGDTDTVAAVTGALAGAVYGFRAIPSRWTGPLHVPLPGYGDRVLHTQDLVALAGRLDRRRTGADPADFRLP
ncbi:ADP-ribosylglycohydrolase family protein [Streptomyces sp. NPDC050421]|uniref:ADP-ribosylglycohydrolase family protein n=1 Tax=Streptomyces sp. NPDC050421 TaxID=3365613 RepID=UPI0037B8434E